MVGTVSKIYDSVDDYDGFQSVLMIEFSELDKSYLD